ncbi:hypothetical protein KCU67_g13188, partial [Aureobasidium melanogenum]
KYTNNQQAHDLVIQSNGIEQTRAMAEDYINKAREAIAFFPESQAKAGLMDMCTKVLQRRK